MGSRCRERNRLIRTELSIFLEREILSKEPTPKPNVKRPKKSQERPYHLKLSKTRLVVRMNSRARGSSLEPSKVERTTIGPF